MPTCSLCGATAITQWQRRPAEAELAAERDRTAAWRDERIRDGHVLPDRDFGPLPGASDVTIPVYGCTGHALHMDLAAHVHAADCQAPHPDHLPHCGCTPEEPEPTPALKYVTLPTGWVVPA